jgi:hypothetical protein
VGALPVVAPPPRIGDASPIARDLRGSGVDLGALLDDATDTLVARAMPSAAALGEVLERARGALVRGAPMDVLAALDADWDGAAGTDGGWYHRSAALLLLGLAGESDRVLEQAVRARPGASALVFLRSVARSALGDASGARAALHASQAMHAAHTAREASMSHAAPSSGGEPAGQIVLRAWEAVLRARSGDAAGAQALLGELPEAEVPSPVLVWARQVVLRSSADAMRDAAGRVVEALPDADGAPRLDALEGALHRLGARLPGAPAAQLQADVRAMLQALSPAGLLRDAAAPTREQAVRSVLGSLLQLLAERAATPAHGVAAAVLSAAPDSPPVQPWRREVLLALREGRVEDAARELHRGTHRDEAGTVAVLRTLARGAGVPGEPPVGSPVIYAPRDDEVLGPVRFALVLLPDPLAVRAPAARTARVVSGLPSASPEAHVRGRTPGEPRGLVVLQRLRPLLLPALLAGAAWLTLR